MTIDALLSRLDGVRSRGANRWLTRCSAHRDVSPSLSIHEADGKILVHCFSGCRPSEIVAAMGLTMADLFTDAPLPRGKWPPAQPRRVDPRATAFQLAMGALDRRLRAERTLQAVSCLSLDGLSDSDLERVMSVIADAFSDRERAELLESVADGLRLKSFEERRTKSCRLM